MKTLFGFTLLLAFVNLTAQLTLTTNTKENGIWSEVEQKWTVLSSESSMSVLNFNKELTSFRHIANNISTVYTIDKWDYFEDDILYDMFITSENGNEYELYIDGTNSYVIFFYYDTNGDYRMVRYGLQDSYYDE